MGRSPCCDKSKVKRGSWSPEEDATLKAYLFNHGTGGNWITLPQKAGLLRCGKSCRLRWLNYLRPDIKHGAFTQEEDDIIINMYNKIGSRWSVIASHLPGRTDNDVKNHWNTKLRKKLNSHTKITTSLDKTSSTFQDSPISTSPNFALQFPVTSSMNCNNMSASFDQQSTRIIHEETNTMMANQDSELLRIPFSWMNENYNNDDSSFDFMSSIGVHGNADLFSIFQVD